MRGGILDCRCARRSARRQVGTKGWSYSDRTKGCALELNSTALAHHAQFAELDGYKLQMTTTSREPLENLRRQVLGLSVDRWRIIAMGGICVTGFVLRLLFL